MSQPRKYLEQLFISKVRIKALKYFFTNQKTEIHLRAAVRELNEEINAVRRELARMEKIGLLNVERRGNRKYFKLNTEFVFFYELLAVVYKSFGMGSEIISGHKNLGEITFAVLTQGFTRGIPVGKHKVDLVIVGENINLTEIKAMVEREEKRLGRDIFYAVLTHSDFDVRQKRRDLFVTELFMQDLVVLLGDKAQFLQGLH
jgi:DNA-binding transcriptional ArsR family regulator